MGPYEAIRAIQGQMGSYRTRARDRARLKIDFKSILSPFLDLRPF